MKTLIDHLAQYAAYHRDPRNIHTHVVGVPMIMFAVVVLLSRPVWWLGMVPVSPALACAVVERPRLVLLDEPLSGLDDNLRERLCEEIPRLLRSLGCTAVYATQDRQQAFAVADRVVVMEHGRILQPGSARDQAPTPVPCEADRWPMAGHLCSAA